MNKYQNALDRISSIDLDMALDAVNYDYERAELISDYGISSYPNLEMSGDLEILQNLIEENELNSLALELACKELNKITGSCPLDVHGCDFNCDKECQEDGSCKFSIKCWMDYFKKRVRTFKEKQDDEV